MKHVSGQFCSFLCVCGHCALNFGFSSVIMCGLIGQWMNVKFLLFAPLLFFLFGLLSFSLARFSPNLVFGFFFGHFVLDKLLCIFCFCCLMANL